MMKQWLLVKVSFNKALSLQDKWKSSSLHVPQQVVIMKGKRSLHIGILAAPAKKRRLVDILSTTNLSQEAMSIEERVKEELSCYLEYHQHEINCSPLKRWKCHNKDLLYISVLAKKYLSVCATSCPSERVFNTSENIVTSKRSCLTHDKVDKVVFSTKNL